MCSLANVIKFLATNNISLPAELEENESKEAKTALDLLETLVLPF